MANFSIGKRKLPWRYCWPETTHDEVLARLLDLNQQRLLEEVRGHKAAKKAAPKKSTKKSTKRSQSGPDSATLSIPGLED